MTMDLFGHLDYLYDFNDTDFNSTAFLGFLNETYLRSIVESHFRSDVIPKPEHIILVILYVPVFLLGFLGNGMLTIIIITRRQIRSVTNLLLCNLAVADLGGEFSHFLSKQSSKYVTTLTNISTFLAF